RARLCSGTLLRSLLPCSVCPARFASLPRERLGENSAPSRRWPGPLRAAAAGFGPRARCGALARVERLVATCAWRVGRPALAPQVRLPRNPSPGRTRRSPSQTETPGTDGGARGWLEQHRDGATYDW